MTTFRHCLHFHISRHRCFHIRVKFKNFKEIFLLKNENKRVSSSDPRPRVDIPRFVTFVLYNLFSFVCLLLLFLSGLSYLL